MVKVNCAAIPPGLIESELFGHVRGAFTGAVATKIGRFELANGGTLFLDDIGDLGPDLQTKLLSVPPLRERREDVPLLVWWFVHRRQKELGRHVERIPRRAMERLAAYAWPGNMRELENVIERAVILSPGTTLRLDDSFSGEEPPGQGSAGELRTIDSVESAHLAAVLDVAPGMTLRVRAPAFVTRHERTMRRVAAIGFGLLLASILFNEQDRSVTNLAVTLLGDTRFAVFATTYFFTEAALVGVAIAIFRRRELVAAAG